MINIKEYDLQILNSGVFSIFIVATLGNLILYFTFLGEGDPTDNALEFVKWVKSIEEG